MRELATVLMLPADHARSQASQSNAMQRSANASVTGDRVSNMADGLNLLRVGRCCKRLPP